MRGFPPGSPPWPPQHPWNHEAVCFPQSPSCVSPSSMLTTILWVKNSWKWDIISSAIFKCVPPAGAGSGKVRGACLGHGPVSGHSLALGRHCLRWGTWPLRGAPQLTAAQAPTWGGRGGSGAPPCTPQSRAPPGPGWGWPSSRYRPRPSDGRAVNQISN